MIKTFLNDCDKKTEQIVKQTLQLNFKLQNIKHQNLTLEEECEQLDLDIAQLEKQLKKSLFLLDNLERCQQNQNLVNKSAIIKKSTQIVQKIKQKNIKEQDIIQNSIVQLPNKSLHQLEHFLQEISEEKVISLVQTTIQNRTTLENLQKTKQKYDKIRQNRCKTLKETKNMPKKNSSQTNKKNKK